ncbi:hypothetical protein FEM48_Zijuj09G0090700 [Ziziphus jujuba var. spinosa]|uniref:Beta-amyrin synthase-like n=1 Tax=Ziziphus jujuba var. spinosa TaxID=714518 RepID=A0A978US35_ZIZJJ|nr:hypothetical protein FEM48_Zijuj09G0090700 [Ziziphus jujuba var. spinosa]
MWKMKFGGDAKEPYLFSTNNFHGRQIWEFEADAGTPEERAQVENGCHNFYRNRFHLKACSDLLCRFQLISCVSANVGLLLSFIRITSEYGAEEKQVNDRDVRTWFSQPKLAVYIAEDSLYEIYFYNTAQHGSDITMAFTRSVNNDAGQYSSLGALHSAVWREPDLSGCGLEVSDDSIGDIVCLRYLDVSQAYTKVLLHSIENFHFSQSLHVSGCYNLERLPKLTNMLSLRHLNDNRCESLTTMLPLAKTSWFFPINEDEALPAFGNQLQTLPLFVVGGDADLDLLNLLSISRSLNITHLENAHLHCGSAYSLLKGDSLEP